MQILATSILLTAFASLSPLLTFAALWQVKEWRIDRLQEHLRQEGWLGQLIGKIRFGLLALWALSMLGIYGTFFFVTGEPDPVMAAKVFVVAHILWLAAFCCLSALQFALRRQRMPVWTAKAIMITGTALLLTLLCAALPAIVSDQRLLLLHPLLVVAQPAFLGCAWVLWRPVDGVLKRRILAAALRARTALPAETIVIGITGSAGKTTTKELLTHVLGERDPLTTPAHVNTEIGVAQWFTRALKQRAVPPSIVIVEMGAYRMGEIALLCRTVRPTMGIITSVGRQHIALFGSQERLCQAKGELVEALPEEGRAFLNGDNELCAAMKARARCPVTMVGTGGRMDVEAFDIEETAEGIAFRVEKTNIAVPLHGTHNVTNILLALAAAQACGMKLPEIAARLRSFVPPEHTFAVRREQDVLLLDDTHNASPASVMAAIGWARNQPAEEKVLLFSGLIELGESQDRIHAEIGTAAGTVFDRVIVVSPHCRDMVEQGYGGPVELYATTTKPVARNALLVCVGRISPRTIHSMLPASHS